MTASVLEQTSRRDFLEAVEKDPGVVLSRLVALARATGRREAPDTAVADEDLSESFGEWGKPLARAIVSGSTEKLRPVEQAELEIIYRLAGI